MVDQIDQVIYYTSEDLLNLHPGQALKIYVSQENIDLAKQGERRGCAVVRAKHSAIKSLYRCEVAGNHIYDWIDHKDEKWKLEFYMTDEVWNFAKGLYDENKDSAYPTTLTMYFRSGKQVNRAHKATRRVDKYRPDTSKAKVISQVIAAKGQDDKVISAKDQDEKDTSTPQPIVKPISVPGQRAALSGPPKSRWAREEFYTRVR